MDESSLKDESLTINQQEPKMSDQQRQTSNREIKNAHCSTTQPTNEQTYFSQSDFIFRVQSEMPPSKPEQTPEQSQLPLDPTPQVLQQAAPPSFVLLNKITAPYNPIHESHDDNTKGGINDINLCKNELRMKKRSRSKARKEVRRKRKNVWLGKLLKPKNAWQILYKLKLHTKLIISQQLNTFNQKVYNVTVDVEGKQHHAKAMSKVAARELACEEALKDLYFNDMVKVVRHDNFGPMDHEESGSDTSMDSKESNDSIGYNSVSKKKSTWTKDKVPWHYLAKFALHKLLLECQNEILPTPVLPNSQSNTLSECSAPKNFTIHRPLKKMPKDMSKCSPMELLNQLKPSYHYTEEIEVFPAKATFTKSVLIDGHEYVGVADTKKRANRECATSALIDMGILKNDVE